jgi:hypothetical protein
MCFWLWREIWLLQTNLGTILCVPSVVSRRGLSAYSDACLPSSDENFQAHHTYCKSMRNLRWIRSSEDKKQLLWFEQTWYNELSKDPNQPSRNDLNCERSNWRKSNRKRINISLPETLIWTQRERISSLEQPLMNWNFFWNVVFF